MKGFTKVCAMNLERDSEGRIVKENPLLKKNSPETGLVPYCKFKLCGVPGGGIYLIKVDGEVKHFGGVEDLNRYFYGECNREDVDGATSSQGWPAECRLRQGLPAQVKSGNLVEVWFFVADANRRFAILSKMLKSPKTRWDQKW